MSDTSYRGLEPIPARGRTDWGAIWGGVFVFIAIWSVFAALGIALFANLANPAVAKPILAMSARVAIWFIVLTCIAMFIGGRETGHLAGTTNRHDGLIHGLMMFGLSIVALSALAGIGSMALGGGAGMNAGTHTPYLVTVFAHLGWAGFIALFLGWLAAMFGASSGVSAKPEAKAREIRPAA